jgi:hypothetical protein
MVLNKTDISTSGSSFKVSTRILRPRFLLNLAIPALPKGDYEDYVICQKFLYWAIIGHWFNNDYFTGTGRVRG